MVQKPRDFGGMIIESTFKKYHLKFDNSVELVDWYKQIQKVASKEVKLKKYHKRRQYQEHRLQQENFQFMYKTTLQNIDLKLKELKVLFHKKKAIEHKHKD